MAQTRGLHPWCGSAGSTVSRQQATEQPSSWPCSPGLFAPGKQITHDHGLLREWDALRVLRHGPLIPAPGCPGRCSRETPGARARQTCYRSASTTFDPPDIF